MKTKLLIRILASPFVFVAYCLLSLCFTVFFPFNLYVVYNLFGLISMPFIWLLQKGGTDVKYVEPMPVEMEDRSYILSYLGGMAIPILMPIAGVGYYISTGDINLLSETQTED